LSVIAPPVHTDPDQQPGGHPQAPNTILQTRAQSNAHLLPAPQTILDWEARTGVHYSTFLHVRTFYLLSTCPAKVGS
jgi:hypothetical protein